MENTCLMCLMCKKELPVGEFHIAVDTKPGCLHMSACPAWEDGMHAFVPFFQVGSETTYEIRVTPYGGSRAKMCACGLEVKRTT